MRKKIGFSLVLVVIFFITLEAIAWLIPKDTQGKNHHARYEAYYHKAYELTRIGHPFFGHVFKYNVNGINNMGFLSPFDYPYTRKGNDFVVAVMGGSVANDLVTEASEELRAGLKKNNPVLKDKNIVVLNMAIPGHKQPQQFFVASFFSHTVDLMINVEGYNEFALNFPLGFPQEFPDDMQFYLIDSPDRSLRVFMGSFVNKIGRGLTKIPLTLPMLAYSQSYYLGWKVLTSALEKLSEDLITPIYTNPLKGQVIPPEPPDYELIQKRKRIWQRFTGAQSVIATAFKVPAYFFIHPNQYIEGSKKLTPKELETAYRPRDPRLPLWYAELRKGVVEMRNHNINVFDLTQIFSDVTTTLYKDSCCHLNRDGSLILAREIAARIQIQELRNRQR